MKKIIGAIICVLLLCTAAWAEASAFEEADNARIGVSVGSVQAIELPDILPDAEMTENNTVTDAAMELSFSKDMVWLWLVALFAFFIKGLCGFANSLVFTTLLSFRNSIVHVSPIILLLNFPSNLIMVWNGRKSINPKICVPLCAMVIAGIIPGTFFFTNIDTRLLEGIFGIVVVLIALEMLFGKKKERLAGRKVGWKLTILGILSGFVCGFCGTGVLVGTYLTKVTDNTQAFKANACIVYFLSDSIRILMFICLGVLVWNILWQTILLVPISMLGLWLGMKSSKIMNETIAKKIVLVMLIVSGLGLVINNL